jgi:hypothetical protein
MFAGPSLVDDLEEQAQLGPSLEEQAQLGPNMPCRTKVFDIFASDDASLHGTWS